MPKEIQSELFTTPFHEFVSHLADHDNYRILFSGKYGIGKTTFIKWFFNRPEINEQYSIVHLFPINYSVANNEDIFKYIKMDILIYLLQNTDIKIEHIKLSSLETLPSFLRENGFEIFTAALSIFAASQGDLNFGSSLMAKIDLLKKRFTEHKDTLQPKLSDANQVSRFMVDFVNKEGSIYEFNFISELIVQLLNQWKGENSKKELILVIDDLDRIDPNHIFRLFNVFGAHFDHPSSSEKHNKFGFDRIIFVADVNNIRNIFHSRYGANTDFSGYIDKFYSNHVFSFNNVNDIRAIVIQKLENIEFQFKENNRRHVSLNHFMNSGFIDTVELFLSAFLVVGQISFRTLEKKKIIINNRKLNAGQSVYNYEAGFVLKIECLVKIVGSISHLLNCLDSANREIGNQMSVKNYNHLIGEALAVFNIHKYGNGTEGGIHNARIGEKILTYNLKLDDGKYYATEVANIMDTQPLEVYGEAHANRPSIFEVYLYGIKHLQRLGYFS